MDVTTLLERFKAGDRRALARAITWVENGAPEAGELLRATFPDTGKAHVIGITGPPGAGKSTLVDKLAVHLRQRGKSVAIVAVDPSSPFSGGAILGDRIRMQRSVGDQGIFMRSLASRGHLGGLSVATADVVGLLDAFGFDTIIVETVGAGQSEVEIMELAHTTCVVMIPGMGDDIQAIKAGILEIGDVFAINKADREGADRAVSEIEAMLDLGHMGAPGINRWDENPTASADALKRLDRTGHHSPEETAGVQAQFSAAVQNVAERHGLPLPGHVTWRPPVVKTIAKDDQGVDSLVDWILQHLAFLQETGRWERMLERNAANKLRELVGMKAARRVLDQAAASGLLEQLTASVINRQTDPYTAAEKILSQVCCHGSN
ncbi:MAG TPA: methylmalonyl Co-A mutase-associated GTPase MeaB [Symbiobacteriaceae bacterium]